jgi:glycosyltransferase involved in cell wall biosynthesis
MVSVIIPSYNSEQTIEKCLNALQKQSYKGGFEIILVDSSIDTTPAIVRTRFPGIKFFHLEKKTDPGTARNIGIKEAKGEIIAFIDSDCVANSDWLDKIVVAHDLAYNVVGGAVRPANDSRDTVGWAGYVAEFREFLPESAKREVGHIPTCNISYKKRIFEQFGLFEGKFYPQEDLVFNYHLGRKGEKILFDPEIQVRHYHRSELRAFLNHQRKIGLITAQVLTVIPLDGAAIVRNPLSRIFLLPFLPLVKFVKTVRVFMRFQPRTIWLRPATVLLFGFSLIHWGLGFAQGVFNE